MFERQVHLSRPGWFGACALSVLLIAACSSDDTMPDSAADPGGASSGTRDEAAASGEGGSGGSPVADADDGTGSSASGGDDATGDASGDGAGDAEPADDTVQPGDDAAGDSGGPTGPPDYGAPGPYEVVIDENVGESHRNTGVADDTSRCEGFLSAVGGGSDEQVAESLTSYPEDMDRQLYTLYRPAELADGMQYPVITWGNGTCAHPLLYEELLTHLASHGFLVIATNSRWVGGGTEMHNALDFMIAENDNPDSPLHGKVATDMLGASGHSQGSGGTIAAGADDRIVVTVPIQGAREGGVSNLAGPTFLIAGEEDTLVSPASVETAFQAATVPAVYGLSLGQGHLMPGRNPAPILEAVTGWFRIHLWDDEQARPLFYDACTLCSDDKWEIQTANL